jgi:hypothetical protein
MGEEIRGSQQEQKENLLHEAEMIIDELLAWEEGHQQPTLGELEQVILQLRQRLGRRMVEGGAKQFNARLAGAGMHWSRAGAERMIPLRAAILSNRFDACWQAAYNLPPN